MKNSLEKLFHLSFYKTTIRTELTAGLTTFLTMAYIIFVNPSILNHTGLPIGAAFTATCCSAIIGCALVGLFANYPIAVAPGMGLNVYFTYVIVLTLGYSWQQALACVFIAGIVFLLLTTLKIRQLIINSIPHCINVATAAGIGLFIGIIALKNAGIIVGNKATLVQLGDMTSASVLLCFAGFFIIAILDHYRIPGAIVISIIFISLIALLLGKTSFYGIVDIPPSVSPSFLAFNFHDLFNRTGFAVIFTFVIVALFDSSGTLIGVLHDINPLNTPEEKKRFARALASDSVATIAGSMLGTSTTSTFVESAAGVRAGGRTGLTAVTVSVLFIFALFLSPLAKMIPTFATAPALLFIACIMLKHMGDVHWDDLSEAIPSAITMMMIPFTFSIANGIGLGFISYTIIKCFTGNRRDLNPTLVILSILFVLYFFADKLI